MVDGDNYNDIKSEGIKLTKGYNGSKGDSSQNTLNKGDLEHCCNKGRNVISRGSKKHYFGPSLWFNELEGGIEVC